MRSTAPCISYFHWKLFPNVPNRQLMPVEIDMQLLKFLCVGNGVVVGNQYSGVTGDLLARMVGSTATP